MAKLLDVKANFDWAETRGKKLVVFTPHYSNPQFTRFALEQIHTQVNTRDYLIIVGNDNVEENWDAFYNHNVRSFTLLHDTKGPRNGAFIRNYCLRRCESDWIMQKDGEVIVTGDFIYRIVYCHMPWRAGRIYVLSDIQTTQMLQNGVNWFLNSSGVLPTKIVELTVAVNSYQVKEIIEKADGRVNPSTYFHYAYAAPTSIFSKIGGYDEDYVSYGWEDADMFCRLFANGIYLVPDYACAAIHPHHPKAADCTPEKLLQMRRLFVKKSPADYFRNKNHGHEWGQGV